MSVCCSREISRRTLDQSSSASIQRSTAVYMLPAQPISMADRPTSRPSRKMWMNRASGQIRNTSVKLKMHRRANQGFAIAVSLLPQEAVDEMGVIQAFVDGQLPGLKDAVGLKELVILDQIGPTLSVGHFLDSVFELEEECDLRMMVEHQS